MTVRIHLNVPSIVGGDLWSRRVKALIHWKQNVCWHGRTLGFLFSILSKHTGQWIKSAPTELMSLSAESLLCLFRTPMAMDPKPIRDGILVRLCAPGNLAFLWLLPPGSGASWLNIVVCTPGVRSVMFQFKVLVEKTTISYCVASYI